MTDRFVASPFQVYVESLSWTATGGFAIVDLVPNGEVCEAYWQLDSPEWTPFNISSQVSVSNDY